MIFTRKIDDLGRIALPKEIRFAMNVGEYDALDITTDGKTIVLKKHYESDKEKEK